MPAGFVLDFQSAGPNPPALAGGCLVSVVINFDISLVGSCVGLPSLPLALPPVRITWGLLLKNTANVRFFSLALER